MIPIRTPIVQPRSNGDPLFIGEFRLLGRLGRGGFGTVYLAARTQEAHGGRENSHGSEFAAVKVARLPDVVDEASFRSRFAKEVAAIGRAGGKYAPKLLDERSGDDPPWLATELVAGISLDKVVTSCGPLPESTVWQLGAGLAEALAAVHASKLVHRDLKPHNVLVTPDQPWIIDFGLAHLTDTRHLPSSQNAMATLQYAAPEQIIDGLFAAEAPADIFALGATLLYAATGHPPRDIDGRKRFLTREGIVGPNLAGLPRGLYGVVENCMLTAPEARPSLAELRAEISRHTRGGGTRGGFADALPRDVHYLLADYQDELAAALGARGPARLGWVEAEGGMGRQPADLPGIRSFDAPATMPYTLVETQFRRPVVDLDTARTVSLRPGAKAADRSSVWPATAPPDHRYQERPARPDPPGEGQGGTHWPCSFDDWICSAVAVHDDLCVVASLDGMVTALWADTGTPVKWSPANLGGRIYGSVAIAPGGTGAGSVAFAAVADGSLWAIDLASGNRLRILPAGMPVEGTPVVVVDPVEPRVYVVRADGTLFVIDPRTLVPQEFGQLEGGTTGALAATGDMVFAADTAGGVHVLDVVTRDSAGRVVTDGQVVAAPLAVGDRLYVAGTDGVLYEAAIPDSIVTRAFALGAPVHVPPVHEAGALYVADSGGTVHAYLTGSGAAELARGWRPPRLGQEISGLAVCDGVLYVASGYEVTAFDGRTGASLGRVAELNCLVAGPPVVSGRFCYLTGLGGVVDRVALR